MGTSVLEIGSGTGHLISYLARRGNSCCATEISKERGERCAPFVPNLCWHNTDGVNLASFEKENSFDYVISDQVVEHLHPDDLATHFSNVFKILKARGQYILRTPHCSMGPSDLSKVFGFSECRFMHLHEFDFAEIKSLMTNSGFKRIYAVFRVPILSKAINLYALSSLFFGYQLLFDMIEEGLLKSKGERAAWRRALRCILIENAIWVAGEK